MEDSNSETFEDIDVAYHDGCSLLRNTILQDILKGFQDCIWEYKRPKTLLNEEENAVEERELNPTLMKTVDFLKKVKAVMTHLPDSTCQLLRDRLLELIEEECISNYKVSEFDLQILVESFIN